MPRDYYEILGVARTATEAELKKAYRQIAMKHHPDRNPGDTSAEERFKEANEAYAVLSDSEKRAHYDRFGTVAGGAGFDGDFSSLFEDLLSGFGFSGGRGRGARSRGQRGDDLEYQLEITLEEAASGVDPKIQVPRLETCEACRGNGKTSTPFTYAGPLTESVLLGCLATRFPKKLEWDADGLKVTNVKEANRFVRRTYRKGWEVEGL